MLDRSRVEAANVLVAGDAMLDRYWFGAVDRISPEAPVPVLRVDHVEERPGGAANVAMNVASLGAGCVLVGIRADDEAGERLQQLLARTPIEARLAVDAGGRTVTKLRMVSRNQQLIRADFDGEPTDTALDRYLELYESALDPVDVVVVSDYGKGGMRRVERMIEAAVRRGKPVLVDPKGSDFARYAGATVITPNLQEFEAVAGRVEDDEDLRRKAAKLVGELGVHGILITRGDRGMVLVEEQDQIFDYPAAAREVFDVSGAGDTVIAAFGLGYALALKDEAAVRLANLAAGVVVGKFGTGTVSFEEISEAIRREGDRSVL